MPQNTPTLWADSDFSPDIVRFMASPDTKAKIDQRLFPLTPQVINDMPQYLEAVNTIIKNGGLKEISAHELTLIQAFIRGNNNPEEIIDIERQYDINMVLWLHFYLELTHRDQREKEYQDFLTWPLTDDDELSEESIERMLKKVQDQLATMKKVNELLGKYK